MIKKYFMHITIALTQTDINTRKLGNHFEIMTGQGISINFTPEALDEFLYDVECFKMEKQLLAEGKTYMEVARAIANKTQQTQQVNVDGQITNVHPDWKEPS